MSRLALLLRSFPKRNREAIRIDGNGELECLPCTSRWRRDKHHTLCLKLFVHEVEVIHIESYRACAGIVGVRVSWCLPCLPSAVKRERRGSRLKLGPLRRAELHGKPKLVLIKGNGPGHI